MDHFKFIELLQAIEGKPVILVEKGEFLYVRKVRISEARIGVDGFDVRVSALKTPGLLSASAPWKIGSAWADVSVGASSWISDSNKWQVFHDLQVVERIGSLVANLPVGETYKDDFYRFPAPRRSNLVKASSKFVARNTPGPVYAAVADFIKQQEHEHYRHGERVYFMNTDLSSQQVFRPGIPPQGSVPIQIGAVKPDEFSKVETLLKAASVEGVDAILGPPDTSSEPILVYANRAVSGDVVVTYLACSRRRIRVLYVLPVYRRQKIGVCLVAALIEKCAGEEIDAGIDAEPASAAAHFLEHLGFVATGDSEHYDGRSYRHYRRAGKPERVE